MGVNITTIAYLRVFIIEIGSTIILMVVEAQGIIVLEPFFSPKYTQRSWAIQKREVCITCEAW